MSCSCIRWMTLAVILLAPPTVVSAGSPVLEHWQDYDAGEREKAIRNYQRFLSAPPEKRREIERQYDRWRRMPEEERERIRQNYQRYRNLPEEERRLFDRKYRQWRQQESD